METWIQMIVTVVCSVVASSGFWAFVQKHNDRKHADDDLLLGLGHDRIIDLCMRYIDRGWITQEEYENLNDYLYKPYVNRGGNGTAKRMMQEVERLPIHASMYFKEERKS